MPNFALGYIQGSKLRQDDEQLDIQRQAQARADAESAQRLAIGQRQIDDADAAQKIDKKYGEALGGSTPSTTSGTFNDGMGTSATITPEDLAVIQRGSTSMDGTSYTPTAIPNSPADAANIAAKYAASLGYGNASRQYSAQAQKYIDEGGAKVAATLSAAKGLPQGYNKQAVNDSLTAAFDQGTMRGWKVTDHNADTGDVTAVGPDGNTKTINAYALAQQHLNPVDQARIGLLNSQAKHADAQVVALGDDSATRKVQAQTAAKKADTDEARQQSKEKAEEAATISKTANSNFRVDDAKLRQQEAAKGLEVAQIAGVTGPALKPYQDAVTAAQGDYAVKVEQAESYARAATSKKYSPDQIDSITDAAAGKGKVYKDGKGGYYVDHWDAEKGKMVYLPLHNPSVLHRKLIENASPLPAPRQVQAPVTKQTRFAIPGGGEASVAPAAGVNDAPMVRPQLVNPAAAQTAVAPVGREAIGRIPPPVAQAPAQVAQSQDEPDMP